MRRVLLGLAVALLCGVLVPAATAVGGGITFAAPIATLDLTGALDRLPIAVDSAFLAIEGALVDFGMTPADLAEIRERIDQTLEQIDGVAGTFPPLLPVPMFGGTIEVSLPLIVVDSFRLTGGLLTDGMLRGIARLAGTEIPEPLLSIVFDGEGIDGGVAVDAALSASMLSTDVVKRFDALVLALTLGAGIDLIRGSIRPIVELDLPAEYADEAAAALTAAHLDGMTWSTFAAHAAIGFEIGPPFLRLYGDIRFFLPISRSAGWWDLRAGSLAAVLGVVIRF